MDVQKQNVAHGKMKINELITSMTKERMGLKDNTEWTISARRKRT